MKNTFRFIISLSILIVCMSCTNKEETNPFLGKWQRVITTQVFESVEFISDNKGVYKYSAKLKMDIANFTYRYNDGTITINSLNNAVLRSGAFPYYISDGGLEIANFKYTKVKDAN